MIFRLTPPPPRFETQTSPPEHIATKQIICYTNHAAAKCNRERKLEAVRNATSSESGQSGGIFPDLLTIPLHTYLAQEHIPGLGLKGHPFCGFRVSSSCPFEHWHSTSQVEEVATSGPTKA